MKHERRTTDDGRRNTRKGFILLWTFIFMVVLTIIMSALIFTITHETRDVGGQVDDYKLLNLADAGVERAHREIRDDYLTTTQTGTGDLRGADTAGSVVFAGDPDNIRYIDEGATVNLATTGVHMVFLKRFDSNYTNTKIVSVEVHAVAGRSAGTPPNPSLTASYTTTGGGPYTTIGSQSFSSPTLQDKSFGNINGLTWPIIMSDNFILRVDCTVGGTRTVNLDALYLKVEFGIDTLTEDWATGSYATFPITLGSGTIESITITDEAGKVHLNYASQALLSNLLQNLSIADANTKATDIVNYRGAGLTNPFDSVEELQKVTSITASDYNTIKDYVTVYSFVNSYVYRPVGPRAPVNINTASSQVLKAIFDPLGLGSGDSTSLANDIISSRPFSCFYSSATQVHDDFYDFINSRGYLTAAERNIVLDNADSSYLIPVSGFAGFDSLTTEFCYATNIFKINSLADIHGRGFRVKTILGTDGAHTFTTYVGDTASVGYRVENYE